MSLHYAVLGVLEARPMTGYELTRFFEASASWVWSAPQSQIYPLLRRLEGDDLIAGVEQMRGERMRRVQYHLTDAGLADLRDWTAQAHAQPGARDPFLVQALFFDLVDADDAVRVLRAQAEASRAQAEDWAAHATRLRARETPLLVERLRHRPAGDHQRIADYKAHVFDLLVRQATAREDWAREYIELLEHDA